jgi:hypothetical protein
VTLAKIPDITPSITINRDNAIDLLIVSIALVEMSLSRIISAEAEKIQLVTGIIPGITPAPSLSEILAVDQGVKNMLACVAENGASLQAELSTVLSAARGTAGDNKKT